MVIGSETAVQVKLAGLLEPAAREQLAPSSSSSRGGPALIDQVAEGDFGGTKYTEPTRQATLLSLPLATRQSSIQ